MSAELVVMIGDISRAVDEDRMTLSEKEGRLVESVRRRMKKGEPLSDKQDEWFVEIWKRSVK